MHTRPRPGPLFTTRPRLAVRTELTLCALARRLPTHQWVLSRSNFTPARVGTVASELGRADVPQGTFQADGQARRQPAQSGEATCMERLSRHAKTRKIAQDRARTRKNARKRTKTHKKAQRLEQGMAAIKEMSAMPEDAEERCGAEVAAHHCPLRNGNGMAQVARQQPALLDQLRAHLEDAQRRVEDQEDQKHLDEAVSERTQLKLEHRPEATPHFTA